MVHRGLEHGDGDRLVSARAHLGAFGALAARQTQSAQKNGFAGAGLARQRGQTGVKHQIERVDQDDVTDGERSQHSGSQCA